MNLLRIKALDAAFESAIDVGSWEDAKKLGEDVEPGYRSVNFASISFHCS